MAKKQFSYTDAFDIQKEHLQQLGRVLNHDSYINLLYHVIACNANLVMTKSDCHDVVRGDDLMDYIRNMSEWDT